MAIQPDLPVFWIAFPLLIGWLYICVLLPLVYWFNGRVPKE